MEVLRSFIKQFHSLFGELCNALVDHPKPSRQFTGLSEILCILQRLQALCKFIVSVVPLDVKVDSSKHDLKVYLKVLEVSLKFDLVEDSEVCC